MTEGAASTTVFSLCADPPASLPTGFHGGDAVLDAAWLVSETERRPCHLRKFSAAGATLRVAAPLEPGDVLILELQNGQAIEGHIGWSTEDEAGFVFDAPMDVVSTLARNLAILPAERRRVPRVELQQSVGIRHGDQFEMGRTRDLSQAGVGLETRLDLAEGDAVQVAFDGMSALGGIVKWAQDGKAGIAFDTELAWQTLMPWLREAQNAPSPRTPASRGIDDARSFGLANDKAAIRIDAPARVREGARWWNVQIRMLTPHLVEFDTPAAGFAKGAQLWIALPGAAGWPASVIEADQGHYLAEFRLPLRKHDLDLLGLTRMAQR